jgi:hypothetical protein
MNAVTSDSLKCDLPPVTLQKSQYYNAIANAFPGDIYFCLRAIQAIGREEPYCDPKRINTFIVCKPVLSVAALLDYSYSRISPSGFCLCGEQTT